MLPRIADAVGSEIEVLFDGGIRSGQDLMRALALGAKGCLIGRAYVYGLGRRGPGGRRKRSALNELAPASTGHPARQGGWEYPQAEACVG